MPHVPIMAALPDVARQGFPVSFFATVRLANFDNAKDKTVYLEFNTIYHGKNTIHIIVRTHRMFKSLNQMSYVYADTIFSEESTYEVWFYVQGPIKNSACLQRKTITSRVDEFIL